MGIKELIDTMLPILNERQRRIFLAKQAVTLGYGGITEASNYTGVSRQTITNGVKELNEGGGGFIDMTRSGRTGGGGKNVTEHHPEIVRIITGLIDGRTKGNPENSLLWTSKSMRNIKAALEKQEITVSHTRIKNRGIVCRQTGRDLQRMPAILTGAPGLNI